MKNLRNKFIMAPANLLYFDEIGTVKDVIVEGDTVKVIFVLPFSNIPTVNDLIFSVSQHIMSMNLNLKYETVLMKEEDKARFMQLEAEGWKGILK